MTTTKPPSRRAAIRLIGTGVAAAATGCLTTRVLAQAADPSTPPYKPVQQTKLTQAAAHYQDKANGNQICGTCPYFLAPDGCGVVEGKVSVTGWCPIWTNFQPGDRGGVTNVWTG